MTTIQKIERSFGEAQIAELPNYIAQLIEEVGVERASKQYLNL